MIASKSSLARFARKNSRFLYSKFVANLWKSVAISGIVLYLFYIILSNHPCCRSSVLLANFRYRLRTSSSTADPQTNISHLVFGIASSANTWKNKRPYVEAWWQPNKTQGFVFLDRAPADHESQQWPPSSPPFRVSQDTSRYKEYNRHPNRHAIRMARVVLELFREVNKGVRWYVMADDDTVFFVDNLVEVLARYDHNKYFYIGSNSECVASNFDHSFGMAFGGAGYALSYPLAQALVKNLDVCIKRYPALYGSDHIVQSCIADLGVSLTQEKGFHQIDLHGDISGLLSALPQSPSVSLHHLDAVDPIFPFIQSRYASLNHLMEAAKADQSRLLQQTICYHKQNNWSISISWGYSAYIYEKIYPPSILHRPLQTFIPWKKSAKPPFMFNTRPLPSNDPCELAPHVFFFEAIDKTTTKGINQIVTSYVRRSSPRRSVACSSSSNGSHYVDFISKIQVLSPATKHGEVSNKLMIVQVRLRMVSLVVQIFKKKRKAGFTYKNSHFMMVPFFFK
ncbi:uncharacterized protein LOC121239127 isoform X1 [Juglans microcarpa x Juglans regia]|uniref:uncharacterized protein LOC121239127 isoform X1 n=1 Tax=Juglans microcarpa x Juglans regia TaxID=2249226 RepID=UPI001B7E7902|nr:uncharacterized protein LOC121239127 isoform X1 [Juglans microcarpa x Juglans regia]